MLLNCEVLFIYFFLNIILNYVIFFTFSTALYISIHFCIISIANVVLFIYDILSFVYFTESIISITSCEVNLLMYFHCQRTLEYFFVLFICLHCVLFMCTLKWIDYFIYTAMYSGCNIFLFILSYAESIYIFLLCLYNHTICIMSFLTSYCHSWHHNVYVGTIFLSIQDVYIFVNF